MQAVTTSRLAPGYDREQRESVSVKELDRKISIIEQKAVELEKEMFEAKQAVYWRAPVTDGRVINLYGKLDEIRMLISGQEGVYSDFCCVEDYSGLVSRMRKIRQVEASYIHIRKSFGLVQNVEQNGIRKTYEIIGQLVDILLQIADPKITFEDKMQLLNNEYLQHNLDVAGESPRDIGLELLQLFQMALQNLTNQALAIPASKYDMELLDAMSKSVSEKLQTVEHYSPRSEKDHPIYPFIENEAVDNLLHKAVHCKGKFSFWKMLSSWTRITSLIRKHGQCEAYGDMMENELGQQIAGLGKKLERKMTKIVKGKIAVDKATCILRKLDVYSNAYMRLKKSLESRRRVIYTLMPDTSLKALLSFAYGLRHELSEIGFMLDMVKDLAQPGALAIFTTQAALKKHLSTRMFSLKRTENALNDALSLFQVGKLVCDAEQNPIRSEYAEFLSHTLASVRSIFMQCATETLAAPYFDNELWNCVLHARPFDKGFDVFFVRQMIRYVRDSRKFLPDCSSLFLLSYYKNQVNIQEKIEKNSAFTAVVHEFEQMCASWEITDLLSQAQTVALALVDVFGKKHDVRAYAKAAELHMEFSRRTFANEKVHSAISSLLYSKLCECTIKEHYPNFRTTMGTSSVMLFEMLACCLYGHDAQQIQAAQEHVFKVCEEAAFSASDDIMLLVYENTVNKILSNIYIVGEKELARFLDGPITQFLTTGDTSLDKDKLQQALDALLLKEKDFPEEKRKVTNLVVLLERK